MAAPPASVSQSVMSMVVSNPADPTAPSFLTSLPAEIRNMIYAFAFTTKEPIPLSEKDPKSSEISSIESHELGLVVPFLRTCRQVYWEATPILYGDNTWLFTRPPDVCDKDYHQMQWAPKWMMVTIGSNLDFIKRIIIDVGGTCPMDCPRSIPLQDILPLATVYWWKKCWSGEDDEFEIAFQDRTKDPNESPDAYSLLSSAEFLNNVFKSLVVDDSLNLRRYAQFQRLLGGIQLDLDGKDCCVEYKPTIGDRVLRKPFKILHGGKEFRSAFVPYPSLENLEDHILDKIVEYAKQPSGNIIVDFSNRKSYGVDFFNFPTLDIALNRVIYASKITYQLATNKKTTSFDDFEAFRNWTRRFQYIRRYGYAFLHKDACHDVIFEFDIAFETALQDVQVNINGLIGMMRVLPMGGSAKFRNTSSGEECTIGLRLLHQHVFLALGDLFSKAPDTIWKRKTDIWINGEGHIIGFVDPETNSLDESLSHPKTNANVSTASAETFCRLQYERIHASIREELMGLPGRGWGPAWLSLARYCF
jgi:hypothetical protein